MALLVVEFLNPLSMASINSLSYSVLMDYSRTTISLEDLSGVTGAGVGIVIGVGMTG